MRPSPAPILIADDSATARRILHDMLTRLGYRAVDEVEDGRDALALLQTRTYGLVISDWHMGTMDGIDLLREARRLRPAGGPAFILVTTDGSWGNQTTARLDGADGFLTKPFRIEALKTKIDTVLARGAGRSYQRA